MTIQKIHAVIVMLLCTSAVHAAVDKSASAKFHGTLIVVECSINSGKREVVSFGEAVGIHRIDGKRYEQPVPFVLDCENHAGGEMPAMTLTPEGTAISFNEAAVATNISGLGIEIRSNGVALPLNKAVELDYSNLPTLTAVPVADPSVELKEGSFNATIRLTVEVP